MFENYPKKRTELPQKYKDIYEEHYKKNRIGETKASSLSQKMESWLHKKVSADLTDYPQKTLEIGAGTLNHLKYEKISTYDIVEPFHELFSNSPDLKLINTVYNSIYEIKNSEQYNRIISIATFEHITDLPLVVAKSCLLMKKDGCLRVAIPNEGSLIWKLAYELTTGIEFKIMYNLKYSTLMNYEHVNTAREIEDILNYFFGSVKQSHFGLNKQLSFYRFFECTKPEITKAVNYIESQKIKFND